LPDCYEKRNNKKRRSREDDNPRAAHEAKKEAENEEKASEIWKEPLQIEQEKSWEENFDEFLEDFARK